MTTRALLALALALTALLSAGCEKSKSEQALCGFYTDLNHQAPSYRYEQKMDENC